MSPPRTLCVILFLACPLAPILAQAQPKTPWQYAPELMRPFWQGDTVEGESVLFIKDPKTGAARASVLFPVRKVLAVRSSAGDVTYESGKDYVWKEESREIVLPAGSRIPSRTPQELRRPAKSQQYELTHRDGNGEIFFGGKLEYAQMQTCITYTHAPDLWKTPLPKFDVRALPRSVAKLVNRQPLAIATLGDSISAGANASALYEAAPFQPAYPELLRRHLEARFHGKVEMKNLSVGGTDTSWGLTQLDKVAESKADLVILAFGMNDSSGRPAKDYQANTRNMIAKIRAKLPECEFILVASMLGNRDWVRLKHELFPQYRDALKELVGPGVAVADLTSIWSGFLELKQDWDQSGNGVNHPNDFGHRVYAQAIAALLEPTPETYDFGRSFLRWTSTKNNHTPRLQVDAACTLTRDGRPREYFLSAMCTGEKMYADKDLVHLPAYEFAMVCAPNEQYMFFKWYAAAELNMMEAHRVGEAMSTQDGKGAPIKEMRVHMAHHQRVRALKTYAEIREAILADKVLNGRTEYLGEDGKTQVVLNYPVKICNIAHGRERWQVDTAILVPDLSAKGELPIGVLRMGYIVFNSWDWAEIIVRKPGTQAAGKSSFSESRRVNVKNQIFCAD